MEQFQDLCTIHIANDGLVAEWQDIEHHPVVDQAGIGCAGDVCPQSARVIEHHVNIIYGTGIVVEIFIDRVIDEIPHERIAIIIPYDRHIGPTDLGVDQLLVSGIAGVSGDQVLDGGIFGGGRPSSMV